MARITCFDGVNCIGGNKILLEDGDVKLFFDFGKNFGNEGQFYEEFLQPKTCAGLYEHVQMGFLPPFRDLYREDLISQLCSPWDGIETREIGEVSGVLVSHAHVDHIGSLHHLRWDIPIYSSPMTAAISRALQDTGGSAMLNDYCYCAPKQDDPESGIKSIHWKSGPAVVKKFRLTNPPSEPFTAFWSQYPGAREFNPSELKQAAQCGGMPIMSFPVDHSVYGATAWAVQTEAGWVVYSGDVRCHGGYCNTTRAFAEQAAKLNPIALLIEGTRITSGSDNTEADIRDAALAVVKKSTGLVVADFGPRNVERLISFLDIARETGRELAILPKDAYLLNAMRHAGGHQSVPNLDGSGIWIYWEYSGATEKWRKQIREEYEHLIITPQDVRTNQDKFICCFSFFDINELPYIKPVPGSVWIYSSCEAFNEEMQIDRRRLKHWLDYFNMRLVGGDDSEEEGCFHVSGHASGPDLMELVNIIRPKTLIPIHTEHPEIYEERVGDICKITMPKVGGPIEI